MKIEIMIFYDLSDLKLGHTQYRGHFANILSRINFLNSS